MKYNNAIALLSLRVEKLNEEINLPDFGNKIFLDRKKEARALKKEYESAIEKLKS